MPNRIPPSGVSGVESCTVSSSLPIPACNRQNMQPPSPPATSSSAAPQVGQVRVRCEGGSTSFELSCELNQARPGQRLLDLVLSFFSNLSVHLKLPQDKVL